MMHVHMHKCALFHVLIKIVAHSALGNSNVSRAHMCSFINIASWCCPLVKCSDQSI